MKKIYITPSIILNFIFFFFKKNKLRLVDLYFISLIKNIDPKIILTFVDNSYKFFKIAEILEKKNYFFSYTKCCKIRF